MIIGEIIALNDQHCGKTNAYSASLGLLNLNNALYRVETEYMKTDAYPKYDNSNNTDFPIATGDLVASQQDYTLPTETIKIDRIEISYDGVNFYRATLLNPTEHSVALTSTNIASDFSTGSPAYSLNGRSIMLYPIPTIAVTGGIRVYGQRFHTAFTSANYSGATLSMGMDINWQEQVAREMSLNYLMDNDMGRYDKMFQMVEFYYSKLANFNGSKLSDNKQALTPAYEDMS